LMNIGFSFRVDFERLSEASHFAGKTGASVHFLEGLIY
jgi:hypothetical protein